LNEFIKYKDGKRASAAIQHDVLDKIIMNSDEELEE